MSLTLTPYEAEKLNDNYVAVKSAQQKIEEEVKKYGAASEETKSALDKNVAEFNARLHDIEQKMAAIRTTGGDVSQGIKSLGRLVVESEECKAALSKGHDFKGIASVEVKTLTSASTTGVSGTTGLVTAERIPGIVQVNPDQDLTIRDLLLPGTTGTGVLDYVRETGFTNNAAPVAENPKNPKPESDIKFDLQSLSAKTIAHFVQASRQIMSDAPQLQSYIDGRLRYGLKYVEEEQLLLGDGTGNNLSGIMPVATSYALPKGVDPAQYNRIDTLRLAMLQATLAKYPVTGFVMNPVDWAMIEMTKDTQQRYIFANPTSIAGPTLWGKPVVQSLSMPVGSFLTGAFKYAAQIFDRETTTVTISTEDRDNFVKNMMTILAEQRLALAIYRPQAFVKGEFIASQPVTLEAGK